MHGYTHTVKSPRFHRINVNPPEMRIEPNRVKAIGFCLANGAYQFCPELMLCWRYVRSLHHVAFLKHPVSGAYSSENYFVAGTIVNVSSVSVQKTLCLNKLGSYYNE
jgi:hypothetical protein